MPSPSNRRKMKPLITVPVPPETISPDGVDARAEPRDGPGSAGGPDAHEDAPPGCVVASIDTCSVIAGSGDAGVMVCVPDTGDVERDVVGSRVGVGVEDGLAERARAGVVDVRDDEARGVRGGGGQEQQPGDEGQTEHDAPRVWSRERPSVSGTAGSGHRSPHSFRSPRGLYRPEVGHSWSASVRFSSQRRAPCRLRTTMGGASDLIITDAALYPDGLARPGEVAVKDGRIAAVGYPR